MSITFPRAASVAVLVLAADLCAQPAVLQVSPAHDATGVSPLGAIAWTFNGPLAPASVPGSIMVFGKWSGVRTGTLALENGDTRVRFTPSGPFSAGEPVTAMVFPALTSAGGIPLARTHATSFWIAAAPAQASLSLVTTLSVRQPGEGQITSYGAYAGDLDNDGFPDLCVPNETSSDVRRFMNDGAGGFSTFTIHALPGGSTPSASEGADFNGDGWTDLAVCNITGNSVGVFLNDGTGVLLSPAILPVGNGPRGIAVLDADSDGDADIFTANRSSGTVSFLRNNGNGTFQPATSFQGGVSNETSLAAGDANGDGTTDLFVGGFGSSDVALLLGDGAGGFTVSTVAAASGRPWMLGAGDVDQDGDVDVVAALSDTGRAMVLRNNGAGGFLPAVSYASGSFTLAIDLGDLDGDGDLDMVSSNYGSSSYAVFRNQGNGTFGPGTLLPAQIAGSCAIMADLDGDEDAEVVGIDEIADNLYFFQSPPLLVQRASLGAALRVNGIPGSPGFGGLAPLTVALGSLVTLDVHGHPAQAWGLALGLAQEPGFPSPAGTLNLAVDPFPILLVDGFASPGVFTLDAAGAAALSLTVPTGLIIGLELTLQGAAVNPANLALGFTLTDPTSVVTGP